MKWVAVMAVVLVGLVGSSSASAAPKGCFDPTFDFFAPLPCTKVVVARAEARTWVFDQKVRHYASRWTTQGRRDFLTGEQQQGCRSFGRYGSLRVQEIWCEDGPIAIRYRSVDGPTAVTFAFQITD